MIGCSCQVTSIVTRVLKVVEFGSKPFIDFFVFRKERFGTEEEIRTLKNHILFTDRRFRSSFSSRRGVPEPSLDFVFDYQRPPESYLKPPVHKNIKDDHKFIENTKVLNPYTRSWSTCDRHFRRFLIKNHRISKQDV